MCSLHDAFNQGLISLQLLNSLSSTKMDFVEHIPFLVLHYLSLQVLPQRDQDIYYTAH